MIKLPNNQTWTQPNEGDIYGSLLSSCNLDLTTKHGELRISPRMILNSESGTTPTFGMGVPCVFKYYRSTTGDLWTIAGSRVYYVSAGALNTAFTEDTDVSAPTNCNSDYSDMDEFNGSLYMSAASTTLKKYTQGVGYTSLTNRFVDSSGLHDLEAYRATNRLYFVDDNSKSIGSIDTADTVATLGNQYTLNDLVDGTIEVISWIKSTSSRIFIGTINYTGTNGHVYGWDGSQTTPNETYKLNSAGTLACVIKNDVPYIIDANGKLLVFNGATFTGSGGKGYLAKFPIKENILGTYFGTATGRFIHYNGMCLDKDGNIMMLINASPWTTGFPLSVLEENCSSGVWLYTTENGLHHKNSIARNKSTDTITDYGQKKLNAIGALSYIQLPDNGLTAGSTNGTYIAGAQYFLDDLTTLNGIFYDDSNDTLQKSGYFVTPKIYASSFKDNFETFYARFKKFSTYTDKIVVKVRTDETDPEEATITWIASADNNTFESTADLSDFEKGDEVEILQGSFSGICSHIYEITENAGTYTVILEDSLLSSLPGDIGIARFQKWKKIATVNTTDDNSLMKRIDELGSTWVQFKVWVIVTGKWDFHDMIITNKAQI